MTETILFSGRVVPGKGVGAGFTSLPWARAAFIELFGIDPYAGTLNLRLKGSEDLWAWGRLRQQPGVRMVAGEPGACDARCYPVLVAGPSGVRVPGVIVLPEVPGYPPDQLEVVAPLRLRDHLGVGDAALVTVEHRARPAVDAVLFDVDGTLVDSLEGFRLAATRAVGPLGHDVSREAVRAAFNRNAPFWDLVLGRVAEPALVASLRQATMEHWPDVIENHVDCFPGLDATLAALKDRGLKLGIYTGSRGESFAPLRRLGLLGYFDVVLTAADVGRPKPHPEGLWRCLDQLGVAPAAAAYVGDTVMDMEASIAAGMLGVGVLSGAATSAELAAAGAWRLVTGQAALPALLAGSVK